MGNFFCAHLYTVFTMGGTVPLQSVNNKISGELQFCSYFFLYSHYEIIGYIYVKGHKNNSQIPKILPRHDSAPQF